MARRILIAAIVAGGLAFLAMATVTAIWMAVPVRIVYQESSPVQTPAFSVEVRQHGKSYFVTPAQKKTLDRITTRTPIVWFGSLCVVVLAILAGAGARLRLPGKS
jgi:Mn2+/Fe2+ NRAMP family transporter